MIFWVLSLPCFIIRHLLGPFVNENAKNIWRIRSGLWDWRSWRVCDEWVGCGTMLFSWSQVDKELLQARSGLALLRCSANKSLAIEPGLRWHYIPATFCESHPNKCCDETSHPFCLTFIWFIGHCHLLILKCFCFISLRVVHILHTALLYNYSI